MPLGSSLNPHARGLAAYWRTVPVLKALGLPDDELYWAKEYVNFALSKDAQQVWCAGLGLPAVLAAIRAVLRPGAGTAVDFGAPTTRLPNQAPGPLAAAAAVRGRPGASSLPVGVISLLSRAAWVTHCRAVLRSQRTACRNTFGKSL